MTTLEQKRAAARDYIKQRGLTVSVDISAKNCGDEHYRFGTRSGMDMPKRFNSENLLLTEGR